jgi:hypothetical protein
MEELTVTITNLKLKVEQLVSLHQDLKKEKEQLSEDNKKLVKTIGEQKLIADRLEKEKLELAENNDNKQKEVISDTKQKINELVQEIDDCIALLK